MLLEIGPHAGEELVADDGEHAVATFIAQVGPTEVLLFGREGALEVLLESGGALFFARLGDVQQAGEHQVGNLLDDGDGIGDATGVEVQPEGVDFVAVGGGEGHGKKVENGNAERGMKEREVPDVRCPLGMLGLEAEFVGKFSYLRSGTGWDKLQCDDSDREHT